MGIRLATLLVLTAAIPAQASIIYNTDLYFRTIHITGTITTDGLLGDISSSDIDSVQLVMHTIYGDFNLDKITTVMGSASFGLTASPTELDWVYSYGLFDTQLIFSSKFGLQYILFSNGLPLVGAGDEAYAFPLDIKAMASRKGDISVLGIADPPDPAPEPATVAMMLSGIAGLGFLAPCGGVSSRGSIRMGAAFAGKASRSPRGFSDGGRQRAQCAVSCCTCCSAGREARCAFLLQGSQGSRKAPKRQACT